MGRAELLAAIEDGLTEENWIQSGFVTKDGMRCNIGNAAINSGISIDNLIDAEENEDNLLYNYPTGVNGQDINSVVARSFGVSTNTVSFIEFINDMIDDFTTNIELVRIYLGNDKKRIKIVENYLEEIVRLTDTQLKLALLGRHDLGLTNPVPWPHESSFPVD